MRSLLTFFAVAGLILAASGAAQAAVLVETNFDGLTAGGAQLYGQATGGSDVGLIGTWGGESYAANDVVDVAVSYSSGQVTINGGTKSVSLAGGNTVEYISIDVDPTTGGNQGIAPPAGDTGTLYMGVLLHYYGEVGADYEYAADNVYAYLGDGLGTRETQWGVANSALVSSSSAPDDFMGCLNYKALGAGTTSGMVFGGGNVKDSTHYIVAKLVSDTADNMWNSMTVFYDPAHLDEANAANPSFDATDDGTQGVTFATLGIRPYHFAPETEYADIGYIVVGDTWGDVVVPEPATLALMGLGGVAALVRRRRK